MSKTARFSVLALVVSLASAVAAEAQVPPLAVVSGRVTGDAGAPVAGARMRYRGPNNARLESVTDADGRYSMSLATGSWEIAAIADGYIQQLNGGDDCSNDLCPILARLLFLERGMQVTLDFALHRTTVPTGTITGTVLDEATGQPIDFSGVQAFHENGAGAMYQEIADEQGRYSLALPAGRYLLFSVYGGFLRPPYIARSGRLTCLTTCIAGRDGAMVTVTAGATQTIDHRMSPLFVRDVVPRGGPAAGGTTVTITGSGFDGTERVLVGTTEVAATLVSSVQLTFVAPAGSGSADIAVVRPNGYTGPFPFQWTWHDTARTYLTLTPPAAFPRSGETANATLTLSRAPSAPAAVSITTPQDYIPLFTITVPAGATSVPVPLRGQRGSFEVTATLPASLGGFSSGFAHAVSPTTLTLEPAEPRGRRGEPITLTAVLATPQPVDTIIELSRNPASGSVTMPEAVILPADQTRVSFDVVLNDPSAQVIATPPGNVAFAANVNVREIPPLSVALIVNEPTLRYGATVPMTLRLSEPVPQASTITFRDLSGGAFRFPASVTVPAGVTEVASEVTLLRAGNDLRAAVDLDGVQRGTVTFRVSAPELTIAPQAAALDAAQAQTATVTVSINAPVGVDLPFTIDSDRLRLEAPASGVIPAGATTATFTVTARASGTVTLTVTPDPRSAAVARSATFNITGPGVPQPPRITIATPFVPTTQFNVGQQITFEIAITPAPAADTTVTITTTDPGMLTNLPESITYQAGALSRTITPRVARAGRTRISVSTPAGLFGFIDIVGGTPPPARNRPARRR